MAQITAPSNVYGSGFSRSFNASYPNDWRPGRPLDLWLCLHPYGSTGAAFLTNMSSFDRLHNMDDGNIVMAPDAGTGSGATRAWKYWDTAAVNEFAFLKGIIDEARARSGVTIRRVYGVGYSNGGFMLLQLAQMHPTLFDAIAILAAADGINDSIAPLATPLPILYVYGDADGTVEPAGNVTASNLPGILNGHGGIGSAGFVSAATMASNWAARNGLSGSLGAEGAAFDLITGGTPPTTGSECFPAVWGTSGASNRVEVWREAAAGHSSVATFSSLRGSYPFYQWFQTYHR